MNPEKQLKKLEGILSILETDNASTDEVAQAFEAVFEIIKVIKDQLDQEIKTNKSEMDDLFTGTIAELKRLENRIVKVNDRLEEKMGVDNESIRKQLLKEVNSLRDLIPTLPDLTYLEDRIAEVEAKIPTIPEITPETGEMIVDKINELPTDNDKLKIDAKHIKNLPKSGSTHLFGGGRQDVWHTGDGTTMHKLSVQATAPENPAVNDLWVDTS